MKNLLSIFLLTLLLQWFPAVLEAADPPGILNHQGRIAVNGVNFDGAGQFKFALVNAAGDTTYWSNDGASTTGDEPSAAVPVTVSKGQYAVLLGDAPMGAILPSVFAENADVRLRLWFSADSGNTFEQLNPDRRIAAVGYALNATEGPVGPEGPQGIKGDTGNTGLQGSIGMTGAQGLQGDTGVAGPQGVKGDMGDAGPQGLIGMIGPAGPQGLQGIQGPQGVGGMAGPNTVNGNTFYIGSDEDADEADSLLQFGTDATVLMTLRQNGDAAIGGAMTIGTTSATETAGMIRWTGTDFEGYTGSEWLSLTIPAELLATPVANMVRIEPGEFLMGSPAAEPDRSGNEGAGGAQVTTLITRGFWMGKYEVTQQEYLDVIGSNPSNLTGDLNRPVEQVSWFDAQAYCAKLTIQERTAGRLPAVGYAYRLPTEAEWEYVCRAGTTTAFSYGNDNPPAYDSLTDYGWYSSNGGGTTHPVGEKLPNPWGLYDMHGNVWEWCQDWYESSYPAGMLVDPMGATSGSNRVYRGGGWNSTPNLARCALRGNLFNPNSSVDFFGFRVVLARGQP